MTRGVASQSTECPQATEIDRIHQGTGSDARQSHPGAATRSDSQTRDQGTTPESDDPRAPDVDRERWRRACRDLTLRNALRKRSDGVPTYSVPEAAALLSVSQEHLYRLIRADAFPAVRMRVGREQGRYVVPARAVEALLDAATGSGGLVDVETAATSFGAVGGVR